MGGPDEGKGRPGQRGLYYFGLWLLLICSTLMSLSVAAASSPAQPQAMVLTLNGGIGPASVSYFTRSLALAERDHVHLIILRLDTLSGLQTAARAIVREMHKTSLPIITFIVPKGARVAGVATRIYLAGTLRAMAPGTEVTIPAMTETGPLSGLASYGIVSKQSGSLRSRILLKPERLSASKALRSRVALILATDIPVLLTALNGRQVKTAGGKEILMTVDVSARSIQPGWWDQVSGFITNPNIAYLLLLIGLCGLIFELASPGLLFPGLIGLLSLGLSVYALTLMPLSPWGAGLMALGLVLMGFEVFIPGFGLLGLGGLAAFTFGSVILFNPVSDLVSIPLIAISGVLCSSFFLWIIARLLGLRRRQPKVGREGMIGSKGEVLKINGDHALIRVHGERWRAVSDSPLKLGQKVHVIAMNGLDLMVIPEE